MEYLVRSRWLNVWFCAVVFLQGSSEDAVRQHEVSDHLSGVLRLYVIHYCFHWRAFKGEFQYF